MSSAPKSKRRTGVFGRRSRCRAAARSACINRPTRRLLAFSRKDVAQGFSPAMAALFGLAALTAQPAHVGDEQTAPGTRPPATLVASFDGLGVGFEGPQGSAALRNPSDNSLAVGPDHVVQTVNSRMAIFTKKGKRFDASGKPLYGPVNTNNVFKGFGGACEANNNGDAVVRYDQIADRWLIVMPIFRRDPS